MSGVDAFGAALSVSDMASSPTFTDLASIESINGAYMYEVAELETTAHDSADNTREFVPGLVDSGSVDLELRWDEDETTHQNLITLKRAVRDWMITSTGGATSEFSGFISSLNVDLPSDGIQTASVTIKVSGARTALDSE